MIKKIVKIIQVILMIVFLLTAFVSLIIATCWSYNKFNYPLLIGIVSYIAFNLDMWWWIAC